MSRARLQDVRVRPAGKEDARAIALAHDQSWRSAYRGVIEHDFAASMSLGEREKRWRDLLAGTRGSFATYVAVRAAGDVLGFISFGTAPPYGDEDEHVGAPTPIPDAGAIVALYVVPAVWRCGIGRTLVAAAKDEMARHGCKSVSLWVLTQNARAIAFYKALGFRIDDGTALHVPTNSPESRMSATL